MNEILSDFQTRLLTILQDPLPICRRPFARLAETLGSTEDEVLNETIALKTAGWIRRFRGQIHYRALGRTAVLVTAAVPEDNLPAVGQAVSELAGVSHNYIRRHRFNLWFTLQEATPDDIDRRLAELSDRTGVVFHSLPALRLFKLDVRFDRVDPPGDGGEYQEFVDLQKPVLVPSLSPAQQTLLSAVQNELPLTHRPFDALGDDPKVVLSTLQSLQSLGVLRRISAVVDYVRLGYTANALFAASIPDDKIIPAGLDLVRCPLVSHCYHRRPFPELGHTLFAMLHARSAMAMSDAVKSFVARWHPADHALLETVAELKKRPVEYRPQP